MAHVYSVLIKDDENPEMGAIIIRTDYELDFRDIKDFIESIVSQPSMRGKFDLPLAAYEATYDVTSVNGVVMGRFIFHDTERYDWAVDGAKSLVAADPRYDVTVTTPEALAITLKHTHDFLGLGDVAGPLRGIPHKEF